jgi:hypothetical protein
MTTILVINDIYDYYNVKSPRIGCKKHVQLHKRHHMAPNHTYSRMPLVTIWEFLYIALDNHPFNVALVNHRMMQLPRPTTMVPQMMIVT